MRSTLSSIMLHFLHLGLETALSYLKHGNFIADSSLGVAGRSWQEAAAALFSQEGRLQARREAHILCRAQQSWGLACANRNVELVAWARAAEIQHPELRLLYAIPNGGFRSAKTAIAMKAEGVRRGIPDLHFPYPQKDKGQCGMWIEMKATGTGRISQVQKEVHENLRAIGYLVVVAYTATEAIQAICTYMSWDNN